MAPTRSVGPLNARTPPSYQSSVRSCRLARFLTVHKRCARLFGANLKPSCERTDGLRSAHIELERVHPTVDAARDMLGVERSSRPCADLRSVQDDCRPRGA